jgi:hypothetical protein
MKIFAAAPVAVLGAYLADDLLFDGQYAVLVVRMLRPVGVAVGVYF